MSKKKRVRALAICVFRHDDRILVMKGFDMVTKQHFFRPLGGRIEFGEQGAETICRELVEEIQAEVDRQSLQYLGTLENIFTYNDKPGHEIVLVYDGALKDPSLYQQALLQGEETDGEEIQAVWKSIHDFEQGKSILYPTGLLEMLLQGKNE